MFEKTHTMENARSHKRLRADYLMKFQPLNAEGEPSVSNVKDISAGGLRFWTDRRLPQGVLLAVRICIPPVEKNLEAACQVLRVHRGPGEIYYIAAKFIEVSKADQMNLDNFIEKISQLPSARRFVDNP